MFESPIKLVWWLPTFGLGLFLSIELSMFAFPGLIFQDPGVGRHLRTAEFILETGQIPQTDPLSFTKAGQPWIDFEWAFEATLGELYRAGGLALVCAFCYTVFAATILNVFRMLLRSGVSFGVAVLCSLVAWITLHLHFAVRPVLFTYLFMALVVEVWQGRAQPLMRDWLILPAVFVAWANLHAGWLAALVFMAISLFGRLLDRVAGQGEVMNAPLLPWVGLTLLCLMATLLNPWGWELHRHTFLMATSLKSAALWDEDLPPNFGAPSISALAVLFIVTIVFLARVFQRISPWRLEVAVPLLFFLYEGLKAQRHVLLLMEVAIVPVARDLELILRGVWFPMVRERIRVAVEESIWLPFLVERMKQFQARQRSGAGDAWLAFVAALVLTALFLRAPISHTIQVGVDISPRVLSFLRDHPDRFQRPLTTTWNAGPLLWNLRPDFRVSIDDRGDFYGDDAVFSFVDMTRGSAGWEDKLNRGNYDSLILDPYLQINQLLVFLPDWKKVYTDEHFVIYWRDN